MTTPRQQLIIVLGMHRSGTSALSGMLHYLGVDFGEQLMTPVKSINDKGFFEHIGINRIHDAILKTLKYHWSDLRPLPEGWWKTPRIEAHKEELKKLITKEFGDSALWGMKDPRACRLLPIWLEIIDEMNLEPFFLICMRHPDEVARSLYQRDKMKPFVSNVLWLWHVLSAEKLTRSYRRSIVFYSDLLNDWRKISDSLELQFELIWPNNPNVVSKTMSDFLDQSLRHYVYIKQHKIIKIGQLSNQTYKIFRQNQLEYCDAISVQFEQEISHYKRMFILINNIQKIKEIYMSHLRAVHNNLYQYVYKIISKLAAKLSI